MARKRDHEEFAHDSQPAQNMQALLQSAAQVAAPGSNQTMDESTDWQVAESRGARKRRNKKVRKAELNDVDAGPSLSYAQRVDNPLRVNQLQGLVLYTLSDGPAPQWVAMKHAHKINQVLVLHVPGLTKSILSDVASTLADGGVDNSQQAEVSDGPSPHETADGQVNGSATPDTDEEEIVEKASLQPSHNLSDFIIPVKAPGDPKTGRFHSPLQAMLISPEPKQNRTGKVNDEQGYHPTQTPLAQYVLSADQLVEAEFPVHPAAFTDTDDAQLEKERRQRTQQSSADGWVDSNVTSSELEIGDKGTKSSFPVQGLDVYALDCEMVLTTDDKYSLARISVLDWNGTTIMDRYIKPDLEIKDYFTQYSGITPSHLKGITSTLSDVQTQLLTLLTPSTILLGHSLESDLNALKLTHPFIIDTSLLYPHPRGLPLRSSLKYLSNRFLKRSIQTAGSQGHNSVEDALAVLDLVKQKCDKGPKWGTFDVNGESIFIRLTRSGRVSAIVEYGTPERGLGKSADNHVGCSNDEEIVRGIKRMLNRQPEDGPQVNFVWARLKALENAWKQGGSSTSQELAEAQRQREHVDSVSTTIDNTTARSSTTSPLAAATTSTTSNICDIIRSLPLQTLTIIYPSHSPDLSAIQTLHEQQRQFRKEFKVKKWNELSVQWTDREEQRLRSEFAKARNGWGCVFVK